MLKSLLLILFLHVSLKIAFCLTKQQNSGERNWQGIASSTDGNNLCAVDEGGLIYTSIDGGVNWDSDNNLNKTAESWQTIVSSSDGTTILAAYFDKGHMYYSYDSGKLWTKSVTNGTTSSMYWVSIACSVDCSKVVAVANQGSLWTSNDKGKTFADDNNTGRRWWVAVACNSDGSRILAILNDELWYSSDSGKKFTMTSKVGKWVAVVSSTSGQNLAIADQGGYVWITSDYGQSWKSTSTINFWSSLTTSSDGSKLIAGASNDDLYASIDYGSTWTPLGAGKEFWFSLASSSDGSYISAAAYSGYIYTGSPTTMVQATTTSDESCFSDNSIITLSSGHTRIISEVKVGDIVLSSNNLYELKYSEVIAIPHSHNNIITEFIHIYLTSGLDLELTSSHLLPSLSAHDLGIIRLQKASHLIVGDILMTTTGPQTIASIDVIQRQGVYTVITMTGYVVVNGVLASSFATNHYIGQVFYSIVRMTYRVFPAVVLSHLYASLLSHLSSILMDATST